MVSFCTEGNGKCQLLAPEMHKVQMLAAQMLAGGRAAQFKMLCLLLADKRGTR